MSQSIMVHKLDAYGVEQWSYPGTVLARGEGFVELEGTFDRERVERGGLSLVRGDRMVETHYSNRWYNVFEVYEGNSPRLKGWYCNITRPARIGPADIYAEDLALDLIVGPEGGWLVTDEDEFDALSLSQVDRQAALQALHDLQDRAARGLSPFERK